MSRTAIGMYEVGMSILSGSCRWVSGHEAGDTHQLNDTTEELQEAWSVFGRNLCPSSP